VKADSLEELSAAFGEWRSKKRYPREAMPQELVERARRAARVHGRGPVARALKIDSGRLRGASGFGEKARSVAASPSYSRLELVASASGRPFAELEMPSGTKLRFYSQTQETLGLLASVCVAGGAR
jgi:hypothetical protein